MAFSIRGLAQGVNVVAANTTMPTFGSKTLERGKDYCIIFRKEDTTVSLAGIPGRDIDGKSLGTRGFCMLRDSELKYNEETQRAEDISELTDWAIISDLLYDASEQKEINMVFIEKDAIEKSSGQKVSESIINEKLEKIKVAYHGKQKTDTSDGELPAKSKLISSSLQIKLFSEVLVIPLDGSLMPMFRDARVMQINLSKKKSLDLLDICMNPNYNTEGEDFLEVRFSYKGDTAQKAGMNPFVGVERSSRKLDQSKDENGNYTSKDTREILSKLKMIGNSDTIASRSSLVNRSCNTEDVITAMKKYLATNMALTGFIDVKTNNIAKYFSNILLSNNVFPKDSKQYNDLLELIEEMKKEKEGDLDSSISDLSIGSNTVSSEVLNAKTVGDVVEADGKSDEPSGLTPSDLLDELE